jgi:uncharacterized protein (DUF433 family)
MTDTDTMRRHIEIVTGAGGPKAVFAGHRVRVEDVVIGHERLGLLMDARNPAREPAG